MSGPWSTRSPWDEVKITALKLLWAEGHSASEIGRRLRLSKNAVIGKIHRLSAPRPTPRMRGNGGGIAANILQRRGRAFAKLFTPTIIPAQPQGAPVTLMNLEAHHCRFIADAPAGPNTLFCGGDKAPGHSYCAFHAEFVTARARDAA